VPYNVPVFFVGHSMGASVAENIAADLPVPDRQNAGCLLIDPARTCWGDAAVEHMRRKLPAGTLRVVPGASVVARVPPRITGYRHPDTDVIELAADGSVLDRPRTGKEWRAEVWAARNREGLQLIEDHLLVAVDIMIEEAEKKQRTAGKLSRSGIHLAGEEAAP
jgi:pimeloyl-ACP methyl ester carboxylesterase